MHIEGIATWSNYQREAADCRKLAKFDGITVRRKKRGKGQDVVWDVGSNAGTD